MSVVLFGCVTRSPAVRLVELPDVPQSGDVRKLTSGRRGAINEVAPPAVFLDLNELTETNNLQPQVAIAYPKPNQVIEQTELTVKLDLKGLSIYKDKKTGLGPHLQIILDNQQARSLYSLDEPIDFSDLAPGSHTLRAIAVKPWGESFKGETAYAQTTFHVFSKTDENTPNPNQPSLTYLEPQGSYGAEPILLDFHLNNAPLHRIAASDPTLTDWRIRCDINGQSFVLDQWQPIYLKGFKPGQNWVQLTLIDKQGNPIPNVFNSTIRLINYDPTQRNTLAEMTRGELLIKDVGQIVDPNYEPPAEPEPVQEPTVEELPVEEPIVEELPMEELPVKETTEATDPELVPAAKTEEAETEPDSATAIDTAPEASVNVPETEDIRELEQPSPEQTLKPASAEPVQDPAAQPEPTEEKSPEEESSTATTTDATDSTEDATENTAENRIEVDEPVQATPDNGIFDRVQSFWQRVQPSQTAEKPLVSPDKTSIDKTNENVQPSQTPGSETPGSETPGLKTPGLETPDAETPDAETLDAETIEENQDPKQNPNEEIEPLPGIEEPDESLQETEQTDTELTSGKEQPEERAPNIPTEEKTNIFGRVQSFWKQLNITEQTSSLSSGDTIISPPNDIDNQPLEDSEPVVFDRSQFEGPIFEQPSSSEIEVDDLKPDDFTQDNPDQNSSFDTPNGEEDALDFDSPGFNQPIPETLNAPAR